MLAKLLKPFLYVKRKHICRSDKLFSFKHIKYVQVFTCAKNWVNLYTTMRIGWDLHALNKTFCFVKCQCAQNLTHARKIVANAFKTHFRQKRPIFVQNIVVTNVVYLKWCEYAQLHFSHFIMKTFAIMQLFLL